MKCLLPEISPRKQWRIRNTILVYTIAGTLDFLLMYLNFHFTCIMSVMCNSYIINVHDIVLYTLYYILCTIYSV